MNMPQGKFGAILADPPWKFEHWGKDTICGRDPENHYDLMTMNEIVALPVADVAADNCVLFLWITWPMLQHALHVIGAWHFTYKTCAFAWMKADVATINMFSGPVDADMKLGYWTRANSEVCLLATRGNPSGSMPVSGRASSNRRGNTRANPIAFTSASSGWSPVPISNCSRGSVGQDGRPLEISLIDLRWRHEPASRSVRKPDGAG